MTLESVYTLWLISLAFQFLHLISVSALNLCSAVCCHGTTSVLCPGRIHCPHLNHIVSSFLPSYYGHCTSGSLAVPLCLSFHTFHFFPNRDIHDIQFHCLTDNFISFLPLSFCCTTYLNSSLDWIHHSLFSVLPLRLLDAAREVLINGTLN